MKKKIFIIFAIVFFVVFCITAYFGFSKYNEIKFEAYELIDYNPKLTTQIFDSKGRLIANYFDGENRIYADFESIPPRLIEALVAIEDTVFFEHHGINIEAVFRAMLKNITSFSFKEGASTLTQQLVKNTLLTREKTLKRKFNEALLSIYIERNLTKEQIIERYLNHIYFGHGYYGIRTAAEGYFHKTLPMLTLKEMAMLVGIPRSPNAYDPTKNYNLSMGRAHSVLIRMKTLGWITEEEYEEAKNEEPLVYNDTLTRNQAPYVVDEVIRQTSNIYEDIKYGGYKIYLSVDLDVQNLAQESLVYGYEQILKRAYINTNTSNTNGAIVVLDNYSGEVLALVGGINHTQSSFNRAVLSKRQTGSSFKPFIYQVAINLGYSPMSTIPDISRTYVDENSDENNETAWTPKNIEGGFQGLITLKEALTKSRNLATINLVTGIGLNTIHQELTDMGFKNLPNDLSMALGSYGISPLEYSKFFGMFANGGEIIEPIMVKKIINKFGNEKIFETTKRRVTIPEQNYLMVDMLKNAVEKGTGRGARVKGIEIAGKTGTTNNNVDTWFCGFSPDINVLIWYGNDNNAPMQKTEVGGRTSTIPFAHFMEAYLKLKPETTREFQKPEGILKSIYKGKEEYFTKKSPLPSSYEQSIIQLDDELIF